AVEERISLRHLYGLPSDAFILVAGSTRTGKDQQIIDVYRALLIKYANIFLVIVPRHPQRAGDIESLAKQSGLVVRRRTSFPDGCPSYQQPGEVFLVDTIGELMKMYLLADIVFVGGSLVPKGGHNLLEPASLGVPSLFGQYTTNFREATALVLTYEAGIRVDSEVALTEACLKLIDNEAERRRLGKNGLQMLSENGGATERHLEVIGRYL
ncbi:MAG: 3-deoxy-D-manno-octulosonic acid transferase, partial [Deltaproteobacteria bacterium]